MERNSLANLYSCLPVIRADSRLAYNSQDRMGLIMSKEQPGRKEVKEVIHQLLLHLPDNNAHEDVTWRWCWNELSDTAQAEVAAVRKSASDLLTKLYAVEKAK